MTGFWPDGLNVKDMASPDRVLQEAKFEWEAESEGLLSLDISRSRSQDSVNYAVYVMSTRDNRTVKICEISHREGNAYPVRIDLSSHSIPDKFRKNYIWAPDHYYDDEEPNGPVEVNNDWVSDSPSEFRQNLGRALNRDVVKVAVFNLLDTGGEKLDPVGQQPIGD